MELKLLRKIALFLIIGGAISTASAQVYSHKVGEHPFTINSRAALEVESTNRGFLPPRMTRDERDAITDPPIGLIVWCTDCNKSGGELCAYLGKTAWVPFEMLTSLGLSTGKRTDADRPVRISATSATIKGTLVSLSEGVPTETGVVFREITGNDFDVLPVLDDSGRAVAPNYKKATEKPVTTEGGAISVTISENLSSKRPSSFRTYAKGPSGISYGNPVIFNLAPPVIKDMVLTGVNFKGTIVVNAGTPAGTITRYGYCKSTTNTDPKRGGKDVEDVELSTPTALAALDTKLNADSFTADPTVELTYKILAKSAATVYFRYYVIANGEQPVYSGVLSYPPLDSAEFTVISWDKQLIPPLKIGVAGSGIIKVNFKVTKPGSYKSFVPSAALGLTKGLSMDTVPFGVFATTENQTLTFTVSGTPTGSLEGNTFKVPGIGTLSTGPILDKNQNGGTLANCDGLHTDVVDAISSSGKTWMDRNLGASQAAIAKDDYKAFGCLYQWGRGNDGHASINWTSATTGTPVNGITRAQVTTNNPGSLFVIGNKQYEWLSTTNKNWQGDDGGINNPCPSGYRVPSYTEFANEKTALGITDETTAYGSKLKFLRSRIREFSTGDIRTDSRAFYWTSTIKTDNYAFDFTFDNKVAIPDDANVHTYGFAVRCIKIENNTQDPSSTTGMALCDESHSTKAEDVTSPKTGRVWMDRNLGASQVATSMNDYKAFGCLYQWGRGNDGHASINWTSATVGRPVNGTTIAHPPVSPNDGLFIIGPGGGPNNWEWLAGINTNWLGTNGGVNNPCPSGYLVPTYAEFSDEKNKNDITNADTAFSSFLKLPKNHIRRYDSGEVMDRGDAFYWTSTVATDKRKSLDFAFNETGVRDSDEGFHAQGFGVRCIKSPTNDSTTAISGVAKCDGIQKTTVNPITSSTGRTWMDRNLGASRAPISIDDYKAYGCLFQWGRDNDGHASMDWTSPRTGNSINGATNIKPVNGGVVPNDTPFILGGGDSTDVNLQWWQNTPDPDLWRGVKGMNNPCPTGYRIPTFEEFEAEELRYKMTDGITAYESPFKFTESGCRNNDGKLIGTGNFGVYWTNSEKGPVHNHIAFYFGNDSRYSISGSAYGYNVRCVKD